MLTRRKFLTGSAHLALLAVGASCAPRLTTSGTYNYRLNDWTGDNFIPMHKVRDGWKPKIPPPSRHVDVAIVGSGIAGLTAAYKLRERSILILEREVETGGNAKSANYRGIQYSKGAAYLVDTSEAYGKLYSDLGLDLKALTTGTDLLSENKSFKPFEQSRIASDFEKLKHFFEKFVESDDFPSIPLAGSSAEAMKLDKISLYDFLKADYSEEFLKLVDTYCYSALGASVRETSAYAGLNFYSEIATPIYAFPGGNAFIAKRLTQKIDEAGTGRIERGCSVVAVEQRGEKVWVSYIKSQDAGNTDPEVTTVSADHAILSLPYFFIPRIFKNFPVTDVPAIRTLKYGSYLVANLCFDRVLQRDGYDHWVPESSVVTDFIDAEHVTRPQTKAGDRAPFVFSIYAPYRNPLIGRVELFVGNRELIAQRMIETMQGLVPFDPATLQEINLTRYGHQVLRCAPGQIATLRKQRKHFGSVLLAHSDGQGMPAIESAITEGFWAAAQV